MIRRTNGTNTNIDTNTGTGSNIATGSANQGRARASRAAYDHLRAVILRGGRMTKYKGKAVSFAPSFAGMICSSAIGLAQQAANVANNVIAPTARKLATSASASALGIAMLAAAPTAITVTGAQAACTESGAGSGVWDCTGALGTQQTPTSASGGALSVTTTAPFSVNSGTFGFYLSNNVGDTSITFTDNNGSTISGIDGGIHAINNGTGAMTITTTGTVSGLTNARGAFDLTSTATATDMIVDIQGYTKSTNASAIELSNFGTGITSLNVSGDVFTSHNGISVRNSHVNNSGDIIVDVSGDVTGANFAVRAIGNSGNTTITTSGVLTGTGNYVGSGVFGQSGSSSTGLTITTSGVVTGGVGIRAELRSTLTAGITGSVTASGAVTGIGEDGILSSSSGSDTTQSVTVTQTGVVEGATNGVYVRHLNFIVDTTAIGGGVKTTPGIVGALLEVNSAGDVTGLGAGNAGIKVASLEQTYTLLSLGPALSTTITQVGSATPFDVNITAGTVVGGSGTGSGIHTGSSSGGTIDISAGATVDGSASGVAIRDGDLGLVANPVTISGAMPYVSMADGTDEIGGDVVITTAGTVTGDAILGLGDDVFNLTGGTFTGMIYGDDRDDPTSNDLMVNHEGNDTFNWSGGTLIGGFNGQDGSDTALVTASEFDGSQVLDGGDDVSTADGMIDTLTLNGVTVTANGADIVNWEVANLDASMLTIADGAWEVGDGTSGTGLFVNAGGTLDQGGIGLDLMGNLSNLGIVTTQDGTAGDTITVSGNYTGGGQLLVDVVLGDDTSASDTLVIEGDVSGMTDVFVANVGGTGAQTTTGILVVDVNGASPADGFVLANRDYVIPDTGEDAIIAGAYAYAWRQIGSDWYLQSMLSPTGGTRLFNPGSAVYEVYPQTLLGMMTLPTMQQRVGNRYWKEAGPAPVQQTVYCKDPAMNFECAVNNEQADYYADKAKEQARMDDGAIWARVEGAHNHVEPVSSTSGVSSYETDQWRLQAGIDGLAHESGKGDRLFVGINGSYGTSSSQISSAFGSGSIDTTAYSLGATATWLATNGAYVDLQGSYAWFDSDLSSDMAAIGSLADGNDGTGYALSAEFGKKIDVHNNWTFTPQVQLSYAAVDFDSFTGPSGEAVSLGDADSLKLRLGISADRDASWTDDNGMKQRAHLYAIANVIHDFNPETSVMVTGTPLTSERDAWTGEVGLGFTRNFNDDKYSVYGEVNAATGLENFGDSYKLGGTLGVRVSF